MFRRSASIILLALGTAAPLVCAANPAVLAPKPAVGPSTAPIASPASRSASATRSQDRRAAIVESNLRGINRSLDADRPTSPTIPSPAPAPCPGCAERAPLRPADSAARDRAQRGSLHRLKRETAIEQSTDLRRSRIEAVQPPPE